MNFSKKQQFSIDETFVSLNENLNFKLFNRLTFDIYFDMRMAFGHTLLDWKDTNKKFGLSVINHRCVLNMENTTYGFRRVFLFLTQAISSYRRSNILFVSGLPAHDNFYDFLKFHQNNLPLLGHGYMLSWVAGLLTNMSILIETFWGKAKTVVSRYKKQNKRDWFLEAAKGMRIFQRFPDFIVFFSISGIYEIAIKEASLLKIPTIAFVDSNCEVHNIPFSISGNDDSVIGLELKIFLFRELILRTMKFRLFTEIDKLLLEGKSLQQLMVDSYMEEFLKEISKKYKNEIKLKRKNFELVFKQKNLFSNEITKKFLRFVFFYSFILKSYTFKFIILKNYKFSFIKPERLLLFSYFKLPKIFKFNVLQKKSLNSFVFVNFVCRKKEWSNIYKIKNNFLIFSFLYKILLFCFGNAVKKISKKKIYFLLNCFFLEKKYEEWNCVKNFNFSVLYSCVKSLLFSLFYFNRILFGFFCNLKSIYMNSLFLRNTKKFIFSVFSGLKTIKIKSKFVLSKKKITKKNVTNFLAMSGRVKKTFFLKSFLFWKTRKLHLKVKFKLRKIFNKYKMRFFSFLKYNQLLCFFPFLKSFFYKKSKRKRFVKHPVTAFTDCVFFLSKRFFFRRKWFFKSPPFLFKRYTKFLQIKKELHLVFPKIFPNYFQKKSFNIFFLKIKNLYKKKFKTFFCLKKKNNFLFVNRNKKLQKFFVVKLFKIWWIWKFFLKLKQKSRSFLIFKLFLLNFKRFYVNVFRACFQKKKSFFLASFNGLFKIKNIMPMFHLIYFELYVLMKLGIFSANSFSDFISARFACFLKVFFAYGLQFFFLNSILQLNFKNVLCLRLIKKNDIYKNKFFLFSLFKHAKPLKLYFAKTLTKVKKSIEYFQNFLFEIMISLKKIKISMRFFTRFFKTLFLKFLKILFRKLKIILKQKRRLDLKISFDKKLLYLNLKKRKEIQIVYCNRKFKQARNFYFLNCSKNVVKSEAKALKKHANFLKLFVPSF